jgi:hypothetical protein
VDETRKGKGGWDVLGAGAADVSPVEVLVAAKI